MKIELEKFGLGDFDAYFKLVGNPQVMAMITERAIPTEEATRDYEKIMLTNGTHPDAGYFKILDAHQSCFVGLGKLEISENDDNRAELGYMILPEYWGKGIASKVASTLIMQAKRKEELRTLFAIIDPANLVSKRILINNGFISKEFKDFDGLPGEILELCL